jgi:DNA-binding NarL/FixJ family response regulator
MKVFVTEDHDIVIEGYEAMFRTSNITMVGSAKTGNGFLKWINKKENYCDVVILDLGLPDISGIEVLKQLSDLDTMPKILVVSGSYDVDQIQKAMVLGALGFITKDEAAEAIIEALQKVSRGKKYYSEIVMDEILRMQLSSQEIVTLEELLSERESEALQLMIQEKSTKEICNEMGLDSTSTFYNLTARMREKLGVKSNFKLVLLSVKHRFKMK